MAERAALVIEYSIGEDDDLAAELAKTVRVLREHLDPTRVVNLTACIRETADAVLDALSAPKADETGEEATCSTCGEPMTAPGCQVTPYGPAHTFSDGIAKTARETGEEAGER